MPAKCVSSVSPRFHYRRLAFCFLPLAATLEIPPNIVLNPPLVDNHNREFSFEKGMQNRSNQKQYHILLAGEKKKTARESLLIQLYHTGAVTATPIDQSKARLQYQEQR
jgi:hypothetical protein